jgi:DoxX-like family
MITTLTLFSGISFLIYGVGCFTSPYLKKEFIRYGMPKDWQRMGTGVLQILGGLGLIGGLMGGLILEKSSTVLPIVSVLSMISAGGLALMMAIAIAVRIKIKDSFLQTIPAILYFLINAFLVIKDIQ